MLEKIVESIKRITNDPESMIEGLELNYNLGYEDFYNALYTLANYKNPYEFKGSEFFVNFGTETEQLLIKFSKKNA